MYFRDKQVMEIPFATEHTSLLILLPDRMRPGSYWQTTRLFFKYSCRWEFWLWFYLS
ncbi:hypothetical protein [Microbulbifer epialgicus]|uniref:Uncharacterized protein n=1 Tax=Microbulbifer epialgicus TaxID=393907 RepID=A0ABV4NZ79_9GAMM